MYSKSLLIAVAAFALSTTGAQAYGGAILQRAKLTEEQQAAFAVARELQQSGEVEKAKEVLVAAGIDAETIERIREAIKAERAESQAAIIEALENDDFEAFMVAIADTPLSDLIFTESEYNQFKTAYESQGTADKHALREAFFDIGGVPHGHRRGHLSPSEAEALRVARAANDQETVEAILEEAGIKQHRMQRLKDGRLLHHWQ